MEHISVNDVVVVVKPTKCCNNTDAIGIIFRVSDIGSPNGHCAYCGAKIDTQSVLMDDGEYWMLQSRIKKIPPLTEFIHIYESNEITINDD